MSLHNGRVLRPARPVYTLYPAPPRTANSGTAELGQMVVATTKRSLPLRLPEQ